MRRRAALLAVILLLAACATAAELDYMHKLPPVIDREIFFSDPEIAGGQISYDGKFITFLKQYKGRLNIWIKGVDEPFDDARPITADTVRSVTGYGWTFDSRFVIYVQDKGGDENYHVYAVDPYAKPAPGQDVPEARDLTPFEGVRAQFYGASKKTPDVVYIGLNDRDERYHDLYKLEISTGKRTLLWENNENLTSYTFDLDGNLRLVSRITDDGGTEILRVDDDELTSVLVTTNEEQAGVYRFHKDGKRCYMVTNVGDDVDLSRLVLFNPETGKHEFVESDPKKEVDFGGADFSNATDELIATYYTGDRLRVYFKNKDFEKAYKKLKKQLPEGDTYFGSATLDDRYWMVTVTKDTDPGARYLYDMEANKVEFLYRPRPKLPTEHLAEMKPITYKSRDGLKINGYLTVPKGVKAKNLAVVVHPHGGPWYRDTWGYDPYAQFLANRGYAVFQPNFRASTGYGKAFFNAGKRQWGDKMQDDITDGVNHLIDKGIADPDKVAIFGGSYGGYATLAGLAFTPDLYAAGVDYVGVSNLLTFLKSIPPYWETARKYLNEHVGDPENPEDVERLKRQSPLFAADKITAPLLVIQGQNDPRVKKPESDQIVIAMRDLGREVEYIVAEDEGHGFLNEENRKAMVVSMEKFLAKHLGGRFQEEIDPVAKKRLDEITVDVASVTLEEPAADPEKAKTAPLPKVDVSHVKPVTYNFKMTIAMMGQEIPIDMTRKYEKTKVDGKAAWQVISTMSSPMVSGADTFLVDHATLLPIKRSATQGPAVVKLEYTTSTVTGMIDVGTTQMPVEAALDAPVFGEGAALDIVIESLPLAKGYETTYRIFDVNAQMTRLMHLEVTGMETVEVPAGSFEAYKIEIKPIDGESGGGTMFVSEKDPRTVVRATMQLPAQAGGGTATTELLSKE
ncbi:MAG: prolyl oligopeptidase family serine peptidase [bacterium]|nr:MAG: prolyl oligopeptidase family serine peptidase [bacterium]